MDIPEPPFSTGKSYCDTSAEIGGANMFYGHAADDIIFDHTPNINNDWARLAGDAGDAITTHLPRPDENVRPVWMTGWDPEDGDPPRSYTGAGTLPEPQDGVTPAVLCQSRNAGVTCGTPFVAHVLNCGSHYLWKLPKLPFCPGFYATEPSDLPHANDIASTAGWGPCFDDPTGMLAAAGQQCSAVLAVLGDCDFDLSALSPATPAGTTLHVACPLSCGVCDRGH